ncbi:hypothetical protein DL768_010960 [Monosporascus sp. mg162]|nr:hypothetical protein DL768_010960 [Monosporascus sp. mg162]
MHRAAKICLVVIALWAIAFLCAFIFICNPVSAQWTSQGTCGTYIPMMQSLIATNAVGDIIIMALPMRIIWSLQTRTTDKVGITACFTLATAYGPVVSPGYEMDPLTVLYSCVICAILRLVYISSVDMYNNITGTMPTTVFLVILEPNLAILCVSIPMLRPFWAMFKGRTRGVSKRTEYDLQTIGGSGAKESGQRSKDRTARDLENLTQWDMENCTDYKHDATVTTHGAGDESRSEKNLTTPSHLPRDTIGVRTQWEVTRTQDDDPARLTRSSRRL